MEYHPKVKQFYATLGFRNEINFVYFASIFINLGADSIHEGWRQGRDGQNRKNEISDASAITQKRTELKHKFLFWK